MSVEHQQEQSQQDYLRAAKTELGLTWDAFAAAAGITPRALKNYRMPDESQEHRGLPSLARRAVDQLLATHRKKKPKKSA